MEAAGVGSALAAEQVRADQGRRLGPSLTADPRERAARAGPESEHRMEASLGTAGAARLLQAVHYELTD